VMQAAVFCLGIIVLFSGLGLAMRLLLGPFGIVALGSSPWVNGFITILFIAFAMSLLGAFEIPLSLAGIGNHLTRGEDGRGAFFTGALAVLVASPCTAPFMGTALGFALTQSAISALAIFLALGAGFALPFTALAFTPAFVRLIPKPGAWMLRVREFLAFPMFATAIWLLWVLSQQTGPDGIAWALSIGLGVVFLLWLLAHLPRLPRWGAGLAGSAGLIFLSLNIHTAAIPPASDSGWAPWSEEAVARAREAGQPVFVDFTAAWCVTCLVNERAALDDAAVAARFKRAHVVMLRGDWTNRSATVAAELANYRRSGVPLYLLYPPDGHPAVLPQILTPATILAALDNMEQLRD